MGKPGYAMLVLVSLAAAGCGTPIHVQVSEARALYERMASRPVDQGLSRDEIACELVLHKMVSFWDVSAQHVSRKKQLAAFYLRVGSKDPSARLLSRFQDYAHPVKGASECTVSVQGVVDTNTGQRGAIFCAEVKEWTGEDEVHVRASSKGGRCVGVNTYALAREGERWAIRRIYDNRIVH